MKWITKIAALIFVLAFCILSQSRRNPSFLRQNFPDIQIDEFYIFAKDYDSYSAEDITNQALTFQNKRQIFFYNRVAKCGSSSALLLFKRIQNLLIKILEKKGYEKCIIMNE